jgi:hypothetical protein
MATTTPNFGWAVPTSTDLVKDGAVAIETLGDAIDASLVDLKGGTTGQVLAKASGTDMDFSWVAQDDSNAIQNAIVDAKGDLIAATANDTPARLAVGANNLYLVADSTAATGLKYEGAITSFTPSFTNFTVGNATVIGEYQRVGNLVFVYIDVTMGSTSSITGNMYFTLPIGSSKRGLLNGTSLYVDFGVISRGGTMELLGSNAYFRITATDQTYAFYGSEPNATTPWTWGTNDRFAAYFYYEVA